jgi:hypothetical protein
MRPRRKVRRGHGWLSKAGRRFGTLARQAGYGAKHALTVGGKHLVDIGSEIVDHWDGRALPHRRVRHHIGHATRRWPPLTWKQDGYLHFSHAPEGMYTIEQRSVIRRGSKFIVTLDLKGSAPGGSTQEMGVYRTLAKAKAGAQKDHRSFKGQIL